MDSAAVTPSATLHAILSRRNPFGRSRNLNSFFSGAHCLFGRRVGRDRGVMV